MSHFSVKDNFYLGGISLSKKELNKRKEEVKAYFDLFKNQENGSLNLQPFYLNGEEQHLLALAMAIIVIPKFFDFG